MEIRKAGRSANVLGDSTVSWSRGSWLVLALLAPVVTAWTTGGCVTGAEERRANDGGSSSGGSSSGGTLGTGSGGTLGGTDAGSGGSGATDQCGSASADAVLETEPVDIIMVVDNSGSMDDELASVEANINQNFATILQDNGVDYRLIAISRHGDGQATSLCVTAPLSTLTSCPAPTPGISERFKHFDTKIESDDTFDRILDTYIQPFGGACLSQCDNGETSEDDGDDNSGSTAVGWHEWLREGAKKVFLLITDDNEDMTVATFVTELTTMAPEFGTPEAPNFIVHSIAGLAPKPMPAEAYLPGEPLQTEVCPAVSTAGQTYQELSILTGGLRFPICQFALYDVVFNTIAEDVISTAQLACDFAIPPAPDNRDIELDKIAVSYSSGGTSVADFGQVVSSLDCEANAFYVEGDRVVLCPQTCDAISEDPQASVDVLFTCESTFIVK